MLRQSLLRLPAATRPLTSTIQPFLPLTLTPFSRRLTTASSTIPADLPTLSTSTSPSHSATPSTPPPAAPYLISRTPSLFLPVYQLTKRGGNKKLTLLKKIQGDARVLKEDLRRELGLKDEGEIRINHVTGHIEIVGFRKDDVVSYLTKRGF